MERSSHPWSLGKCKWRPQEMPLHMHTNGWNQKREKPNVGVAVEKCLCDCWECKATQPLWTTVRQILKKLIIYLPYVLAIQHLGTYPREMKIYLHAKTWTWMFLAALFTVLKRWKWLKCPSADEWRNKLRSNHTMGYHSAIRRKDAPQNRMLKARSQTQKDTQGMSPFVCNVQDRQMDRDWKQIGGCQGLGLGMRRDL